MISTGRSTQSKETHLRRRPDTLFDPLRAILVRLINELEGLDIWRRSISTAATFQYRSYIHESKSFVN